MFYRCSAISPPCLSVFAKLWFSLVSMHSHFNDNILNCPWLVKEAETSMTLIIFKLLLSDRGLDFASTFAAYWMVALIAVDRCLGLLYPQSYKTRISKPSTAYITIGTTISLVYGCETLLLIGSVLWSIGLDFYLQIMYVKLYTKILEAEFSELLRMYKLQNPCLNFEAVFFPEFLPFGTQSRTLPVLEKIKSRVS